MYNITWPVFEHSVRVQRLVERGNLKVCVIDGPVDSQGYWVGARDAVASLKNDNH